MNLAGTIWGQTWNANKFVCRSATKLSGQPCTRKTSMCDGEDAYRTAFRKVFKVETTAMCVFHIKQACKKWLQKHCKGGVVVRDAVRKQLSDDIDVLRASTCQGDLRNRHKQFAMHWEEAVCWMGGIICLVFNGSLFQSPGFVFSDGLPLNATQ